MMLKTEKNSWSDSSICSLHYHITSSAWPGNADIREAAGCTGALKAPFPSSSPRYEISPSFAYMHTQEDAGKNAMTNSEAGQASISDWESACRPVRDTITASFEPADTAQDASEVKIMNVTPQRLQQLSRYLQKKMKRRVKLFLKLVIFNILIILEPVTLPSASECHDSSLTISSRRGPHKATRGRFKPIYAPFQTSIKLPGFSINLVPLSWQQNSSKIKALFLF